MDTIKNYMPELTDEKANVLDHLSKLLLEWNSKINLISRKDEDNIIPHHILHSLSIAKIFQFKPGTKILDVGTGGGLPGLPLAIMYPECQFHLIDGTAKKIRVVQDIISQSGLKNVTAQQVRLENHKDSYEFILSRAVTRLGRFTSWLNVQNIIKEPRHDFPNGILYLKGGELNEELRETNMRVSVYALNRYFDDPYFETKKLIHLYR